MVRQNLLIFLFLGIYSTAGASDLPSVAVYPTQVGPGASAVRGSKSDVQDISRSIEAVLRASRRFRMYERNAELLQGTVLQEQQLAQSGLAAGNAADAGKLTNVQLIVTPFVTEYHLGSSFRSLEDFPGKYLRSDSGALRLTVKVTDTTTGEIKYQIDTTGSISGGSGSPQDGRGGGPPGNAWQHMVDQAAEAAAAKVIGAVFPIVIVKVDGDQIYLNRGEGAGLTVGETHELFSVGDALVDPQSGEQLGQTETLVGRIKVTRITPRFSVGQVVAKPTGSIKSGDIVR
jgi:curli biogenesis system outer membrane secretion channel CsgG